MRSAELRIHKLWTVKRTEERHIGMKRLFVTTIFILFFLSSTAFGATSGGFEGHYFWTADDAIITFTYQDFHTMLDRLRNQQTNDYKQMFDDWKAHMPGGPIYVKVLKEYRDGIL